MVLKSTFEHGWLLSKLLKLDDEYQGRWEQWRWTMETGELPKEIPQTEFLDLGHPQVLQMLSSCLQSIPKGGCGSPSRFIPYFTDWLLYALGHPSIAKLPHEPEGCNDASNRLIQEMELKLLISCPFDYFGHLLAANRYGQSRAKFYPTPTWTARTMAIAAVNSSAAIAPFHIYEPALGTGRLAAYKWMKHGNGSYVITSKLKTQAEQECLFVEQCLNQLQPGEIVCILVSNGILSSSNQAHFRRWLLEDMALLIASIQLPTENFQVECGLGIITSFLVLQRKGGDLPIPEDYSIFMAVADKIGFDSRGRRLFRSITNGQETQEIDSDLPLIMEEFKKFMTEVWRNHIYLK